MTKNEIKLTQVYRINGRVVVADSIEDAISTWREWMKPGTPEITNVEKIDSDSYTCGSQEALVFAEGLCSETLRDAMETISKLRSDREKLAYDIQKYEACCKELEEENKRLSGKAG